MRVNPSHLSNTAGNSEFTNAPDGSFDDLEAEVPVPDRLLPKGRSQELLFRLKLSQKIGLLLDLHRQGLLSEGGQERLLYLQGKASFEALQAGMKFAQRLASDEKLRSDFKHQRVELNRRPQSRRFRVREKNRIGVGYRDKGTLPENHSKARKEAEEYPWVHQQVFGELWEEIKSSFPQLIEGEWLDLSDSSSSKDLVEFLRDNLLHNRL